jgi:hypothetical protein
MLLLLLLLLHRSHHAHLLHRLYKEAYILVVIVYYDGQKEWI